MGGPSHSMVDNQSYAPYAVHSLPPGIDHKPNVYHPQQAQAPLAVPPAQPARQAPPPPSGGAKKPKKPARDPGAPKRNMSAYLLYQNAMREQFKAQNPGMSFGQLSKYTSAMYAQLTPEEKQEWQARAETDKARYEHDLGAYAPPAGYDQKGEQIVVVPKSKGKRLQRDSNAPKKNVSAYLLYQNAMRDKFKRDNPGMSFGQLSKYTSHMYKNLSPEEKSAWEQVAQQDKQRYEAEMSAYEPPPGHDARGVLVMDEEAFSGGRKRKRPRDPAAPKRNKGSFVLFAEEERPKIKAEFPDIKFTDMGVILGERWRALTPQQKVKFEALANEDKIRFATAMDEYNRNHGLQAGIAQNNSAGRVKPERPVPTMSNGPPPLDAGGMMQDPNGNNVNHNHNVNVNNDLVNMQMMGQSSMQYGDPSMNLYQHHQL